MTEEWAVGILYELQGRTTPVREDGRHGHSLSWRKLMVLLNLRRGIKINTQSAQNVLKGMRWPEMAPTITDNAKTNGRSQLRRMLMAKARGKSTAAVLLTLALIGWSTSAQAASITFATAALAGGTLSYNGTGGPLEGVDIGITSITGEFTPLNSGLAAALDCDDCVLNFTTGNNTAEGAIGDTFGGNNTPASFEIVGSIASLGIVNEVLLTGTVNAAVTLKGATSVGAIVAGPDTKHDDILIYFGLLGKNFSYGNIDITANPTFLANGGYNGLVSSVSVVNTVPDGGSAMALLGLAMVGIGTLRRRFQL